MTQNATLEPFRPLIGTWDTEATHPMLADVAKGRVVFEWLEGERFLVQRSHHDHESVPDAISVIGAAEEGDGLVMEYFDSRGVRRTYGVSIDDGVWCSRRDAPGFDQRFAATLDRERFVGLWQVARTPGAWKDDMEVVYRRREDRRAASPARPAPQLFAGLRVSDLVEARSWYERLLGAPSFFPNDEEAVWTLADDRSIYIVRDPERAGGGLATIWDEDDLDALLTAIADRGLRPDGWERYENGVRKAVFSDPDGNEVGFAGPAAP